MKKLLIFCWLCLTLSYAHAQQPGDEKTPKKERVEALKVAFITEKLQLTAKEAQVFWPVYNEFEEKLELSRKSRRKDAQVAMEAIDKLSDKEVENFIEAEFSQRQKELDIQKEYHEKFKKVLPLKKVGKLYLAEQEFKRQLLKKIKDQKK